MNFWNCWNTMELHHDQPQLKNPQANAIVERIHLTIAESLRSLQLGKKVLTNEDLHDIL